MDQAELNRRLLNRRLSRTLSTHLAKYIVDGIRADVLRNAHMNEYRELPAAPGEEVHGSIVFEERFANPYLTRFIKYFTDWYSGGSTMGNVCDGLVDAAKRWRKIDRLQVPFDDKAVDAMLVSFINGVAARGCMDLALYTKDIAGMTTTEMAEQPLPKEHSFMRKIELWTEDHRANNPDSPDATSQYVATVEIIPFPDKMMPKVVLWGIRVFHLSGVAVKEGVPWIYAECFAVVSLTASPGLPRNGMANVAAIGKSVTLWCSSVGEGAPSNASGTRIGYGLTKEAASEAASHWNNQAPFEQLFEITIFDQSSWNVVSGQDQCAVERILPDEQIAEFAPKEQRELGEQAWRLARDGKSASAILLYLGGPKVPDVEEDSEIGLPEQLREG